MKYFGIVMLLIAVGLFFKSETAWHFVVAAVVGGLAIGIGIDEERKEGRGG